MKLKFLGLSILFISVGLSIKAQVTTATKPLTKADVITFNKAEADYQKVQLELQQLEQKKNQLLTMMQAYNDQQKTVLDKVEKLEISYNTLGASAKIPSATSDNSQSSMLNATKQMQETQMSFNLQYLQLQSQMQHENRSYTAISNIMKTKHDTVKNSISNVR